MKEQFESYDTETAMVLGVAGGNGLEHIDSTKYRKVFGVDINKEYHTKYQRDLFQIRILTLKTKRITI